MGRNWTNITFEFDRNETVTEPSSNPRTREEALEDFIRSEWGEEHLPPVKNADLMFGGLSQEKLEKYISKVFREFGFIDRAGAVAVSDSTHAGSGWVFGQTNPDSIQVIEEYHGYEGAKGSDVAGNIYDDYRIKVDELWHWD